MGRSRCAPSAYVAPVLPSMRSAVFSTTTGLMEPAPKITIDDKYVRSVLVDEKALMEGAAFNLKSTALQISSLRASQLKAWQRWSAAASCGHRVRVVCLGDSLLAGGARFGAYSYRFVGELSTYLRPSAQQESCRHAGSAFAQSANGSRIQFVSLAKGGTSTEADLPLVGTNLAPYMDDGVPTLLLFDHSINDDSEWVANSDRMGAALEVLLRYLITTHSHAALLLSETFPSPKLEIYANVSSMYGIPHFRFSGALREARKGWGRSVHPAAPVHQLIAEALLLTLVSFGRALCALGPGPTELKPWILDGMGTLDGQ